jgi:hypothetical protein
VHILLPPATLRVTDPRANRHLSADEIASFVDGAMLDGDRRSAEAHLAICAECRAEASDVSSILRTAPKAARSSRRLVVSSAAVAAAAVLFWVVPRATREPSNPLHREETLTTTPAPQALAPRGTTDAATAFVWSSVPHAASYRLRLYAEDGTLLWERETQDTTAVRPDSVPLIARTPYFWKVDANTGFDRAASSDLVEFTPQARP